MVCFLKSQISFSFCHSDKRLWRHGVIALPLWPLAATAACGHHCCNLRRPQGGGRTRVQWQALRCWGRRSAVRLRERSRKQGPRNQLQQVTNKGRQRARKTKTDLFQEAPESPWQIGGKLVKTNFTRYCAVYKYFHALCCKANFPAHKKEEQLTRNVLMLACLKKDFIWSLLAPVCSSGMGWSSTKSRCKA